MSIAAMEWAWQQTLPATQKLVLVAMADHANKEAGICWPSLEFLANKTGLCTRTIKEARRQLKEKHLIEPVCPGRYRLGHFDALKGSSCPPRKSDIGENHASYQAALALMQREAPSPAYKNPKENQKETFFPEPEGLSIKESHFFQTWHRHVQNGFRDLADTRKTNPTEARYAVVSMMKNMVPSLIPLIFGNENDAA
ncbi:helix-turn-helix domain-containing protein [Acetobacteraceae bacterium]|nr:helix-turn-helix domain-containing protein [Acetobacteraceae bacterium]